MSKHNYLEQNYSLSPVNLFLSLGVLLVLFSCSTGLHENSVTYFGGKIKNPLDKYVYFSKNDVVIDSAKIDENNKFSFDLDSIETGLYTFNHGPEFQYLYLEPKDSLLLYLNTWDFDESLIFSGTQAAKNNYLISSWLQTEKFEKNFSKNYKLDAIEFSEIIQVEIDKQLETYNALIELEGEEPSRLFEKLAKGGIYYPSYYLKEYYPFKHKRALGLKSLPEMDDSFYEYRKSIDLNDKEIRVFGPYWTYVMTYLYLKSHRIYSSDSTKNNVALNYMEIVNEEITDQDFKNHLLAKKLWSTLMSTYYSEDNFKQVHDYFFEHCTDKDICSEIKKSIKQKEQLKRGEKLPEVTVYNVDGNEVIINDIVTNNNTVIYFWPKNLGRVKMLEEKLSYLEQKYPDVLFIGIERDKSNEDWLKFVETKKLSEENQFIIDKKSETYTYFDGEMGRTIIVKSDGNIHNGYLFFNDKNFDEQLKKLKNH